MTSLIEVETASSLRKAVSSRSLIVAVAFFVSGMPALIYQLLWQRALFTMFGINIEAVTVVVAGFLMGLGIGSLVGGWVSCRRLNLLIVFGAIECVIGVYGIASLRIIALTGSHTIGLSTLSLTGVTLVLLFVPTLFMGSTLPILSAYLVRRSRNVGQSVGLLYCVNTAGSAAACLLCVLFLMSHLGMQGSVNVAAAINLIVGASALGEAWRTRGERAAAAGDAPALERAASAMRRSTPEFVFAVLVSGCVGYVSLSYEIVWFRAFSLASNASPAFALVLGVYLAGIANGAMRLRNRFGPSLPQSQTASLISLSILSASVVGFVLLPLAACSAGTALGYLFPMLLMIFVQTTISGMTFPLICHYGVSPDDNAGARVSLIYLANIFGAVAGTLVTGFVLMDALSMGVISALLGVAGAGLAGFVACLAGLPTHRWRRLVATAGIAAVAMPALSSALFSQFYQHLLANSLVDHGGARFVETVENREGVITVDDNLNVYGNGVYDGRLAIDLMKDENYLIRPFSLSLFHPDPEEVLSIGLATGGWEQVIANHPQVKHLTIIEINPGYLEIMRKYPVVASLLENPKVEIVIDDGRRWLKRHPERKFDAIMQNTTWYFRPNATNLLSREYLQITASHLRAGGVIMYNTTGSTRVQRTGCSLFPGVRVLNSLVVSPAPMSLDPDRLRRILAAYRINGRPVLDIRVPDQRARLDEIVSTLSPPPAGMPRDGAPIEDCGGILARTEGLALVTDDNMGQEWEHLAISDRLMRRVQGILGIGDPES